MSQESRIIREITGSNYIEFTLNAPGGIAGLEDSLLSITAPPMNRSTVQLVDGELPGLDPLLEGETTLARKQPAFCAVEEGSAGRRSSGSMTPIFNCSVTSTWVRQTNKSIRQLNSWNTGTALSTWSGWRMAAPASVSATD